MSWRDPTPHRYLRFLHPRFRLRNLKDLRRRMMHRSESNLCAIPLRTVAIANLLDNLKIVLNCQEKLAGQLGRKRSQWESSVPAARPIHFRVVNARTTTLLFASVV